MIVFKKYQIWVTLIILFSILTINVNCGIISQSLKQNYRCGKFETFENLQTSQQVLIEFPNLINKIGYLNFKKLIILLQQLSYSQQTLLPHIQVPVGLQMLATQEMQDLRFLMSNMKLCSLKDCRNAPKAERLEIIFCILEKTLQKYHNQYEPLIYTSFASGELLQDFLTIVGLSVIGYTNFHLNFIDLGYERSDIVEKLNQSLSQSLNFFTNAINKSIQVSTYFWPNAYTFIHQTRGLELKSNILVCVDLGNFYLQTTNNTHNARYMFLYANENKQISLYIPNNGPCEVWQTQNGDPQIIKILMETINMILDKNKNLVGLPSYKENIINSITSLKRILVNYESFKISSVFIQCVLDDWQDLIYNSSDAQKTTLFQLIYGQIETTMVNNCLDIFFSTETRIR